MDCIPFSSSAELIHAILNVRERLNLEQQNVRAFILNAALVMDDIWQARNLLVHQQVPVVIDEIIAGIWRRYAKHSLAWLEVEQNAGKQ